MKVISFIDQGDVLEKIIRYCKLWKEPQLRAPPIEAFAPPVLDERILDHADACTVIHLVTPHSIIDAVEQEIMKHIEKEAVSDDITMVAMKRI